MRAYPGWLDPATGQPRNWKTFALGVRELWRAEAVDMMRTASSVGVVQSKPEDQKAWMQQMRAASGEADPWD